MPPVAVLPITPHFRGPEWQEDIAVNAAALPFAASAVKSLFNKGKSLWGIFLEVAFHVRVVSAVGGAATSVAEAPVTILDSILFEGTRLGRQRTPRQVSGSTLWRYINELFFSDSPNYCLVGINGAEFVDLGITGGAGKIDGLPMANPGAGAVTTDYDVILGYLIPFVPLGVPLLQQRGFMLRPDEWSVDKLQMIFGDASALFDNQIANITSITFGAVNDPPAAAAPAGSPLIKVHVIPVNQGAGRFAVNPALHVLTTQQGGNLSSPLQGANFTDGLISRLTVKEGKYLRSLVKTGTKTTIARTAGINAVFGALSDRIITRPLVRRKGELIRNPRSLRSFKAWYNFAHGIKQPIGYNFIDFVDAGDVNTFVKTAGLTKDDLEFDGDVLGGANNIMEIMEERVEGEVS